MKQFKRITGVALAFVFALTTAVTALAATPEQEQEVLSHAFNVYQVICLLHKGSRRSRSDRKLRGRQRDRQGIR